MSFRYWLTHKLFRLNNKNNVEDKKSNSASAKANATVKTIALRMGDTTSNDFEEPEYDLSEIELGYNTDAYIRQGVDKYVDQIFKEGYEVYGKNEEAVGYIKARLAAIAKATGIPTQILLTELAEDVVKYANSFVVKVRSNDPNVLPDGYSISGIDGKEPIAGYFIVNATTIKVKRDKNGTITSYQQETDDSTETVTFNPEDIIHFYYKRVQGNAFGCPFLYPVLDDVRALRQAEEDVLHMMFRNIHPFKHVIVGTDELPGTPTEVEEVTDKLEGMDVEGGLVTTNRVAIKPIASDQVINAEPYLQYLEKRVFSGMGMSELLFGRGNTANRSTGDNMTSQMTDRIKAIQKIIESFFNEYIIKELLLEGGYDIITNPDDEVNFRFKENDLDTRIKLENSIIYKFEHNAITEDEMRLALNLEPIADRSGLNREISAELSMRTLQQKQNSEANNNETSNKETDNKTKTKETDNKNKPTNQYGTKASPKKTTNNENVEEILKLMDSILEEQI